MATKMGNFARYFFWFLNIIISDAAGFVLKNASERGLGPREGESGRAIFNVSPPGQNLSRANRILIPHESVIEEIHFETNNQLPSISRRPVPNVFHKLGEVKHKSEKINNTGNMSLPRNTNFLPLTISAAFSRVMSPHPFTHSHMYSADRRNHLYHLIPASSSLQQRHGLPRLIAESPSTLKDDPSENRQRFLVERGGPKSQNISKLAKQEQFSPATHWSHGSINHEKPPPGPLHHSRDLQLPAGLNADQISSSTSSYLSNSIHFGDSTSLYGQWLNRNKGFPDVSQNPRLQPPSLSKSSSTSSTATSLLSALSSSPRGVTNQVLAKTLVSPSLDARLPGMKLPMHSYLNETHGMNFIGSTLDSARRINQHDNSTFGSKIAFDPRTTKLGTPNRSSHSKPPRKPLASIHGYSGTLGIFDRYKTIRDLTMQMGSSSQYAVPPNRSNALGSQISDGTQVSANRLGHGNPIWQGNPGEYNFCKYILKDKNNILKPTAYAHTHV